jgi:hypothetical protein
MEHNHGKPALNPMSLTVADAGLLLARAGGWPVTVEMLRADVDAGAQLRAGQSSVSCKRQIVFAAFALPSTGLGSRGAKFFGKICLTPPLPPP